MTKLLFIGHSSSLKPFVGCPLADAQSYICSLKQAGTMYRLIGPGQRVTMDHWPNRVNVYVDKNGNISSISQG